MFAQVFAHILYICLKMNFVKTDSKLLGVHQQIDPPKKITAKNSNIYSFPGVFKSSKRLIHQVCQLLLVRSIEDSQTLVQLVWH